MMLAQVNQYCIKLFKETSEKPGTKEIEGISEKWLVVSG